jgi:HEPN domain-containing protein
MARESKRINVDKNDAPKYKIIAENFYSGALTEIEHKRWNAAGLLIVHASIAYSDTLTIKYGGVKSKGENHQDVVKLLYELMPDDESKKAALNQLERIISYKTTVAYSGEIYDESDIEKLMKHLERFRLWALGKIN